MFWCCRKRWWSCLACIKHSTAVIGRCCGFAPSPPSNRLSSFLFSIHLRLLFLSLTFLHHHLLRLTLSASVSFLPAMLIYRFVAFAEVQTRFLLWHRLQTERSATLVRKMVLQKSVHWKWIFFGSCRHPYAHTQFWRQLAGFNYTALCTETLSSKRTDIVESQLSFSCL